MTTGIIITLAGIVLLITRAPLIWSPVGWRDFILNGAIGSARKMRTLGLFMALVAAISYWLTMNDLSVAGQAVRWFSAFIFAVTLIWAVFPGATRSLAERIWTAFSATVLRVLGVLSVVVGLWLVYTGGTLVGAALANG